MPVLPRPLIVGAWIVFMLMSGGLPWMNYYFDPGQPLPVSIVDGLGGNGIGLFTWTIIGIQLHVEVIYMVFSRRANMHDVEVAAEKARAEAEAKAEARTTAEAEARVAAEEQLQAFLTWYEQVKDQLAEGTPPPPGIDRNGKMNRDNDAEN